MGQYYQVIILGEEQKNNPEIIRIFMEPWYGAKLLEHSYINNDFVNAIEFLLSPEGIFYKSRIVWAGDYADPEKGSNTNLYNMTYQFSSKEFKSSTIILKEYKYIINHTKKLYVNKDKYNLYHPLPLLVAEGNGRSGSDYVDKPDEDFVGMWARDIISIEKDKPEDCIELTYFQS